MILMIDNYDSFTYNIVQYCMELGVEPKVIRNDELSIKEIESLKPTKIIISPGPATPDEAGMSLEIIEHFKNRIPILGICLGHQAIAQSFGGKVIKAGCVMHGKTSQVKREGESRIFDNIPAEFTATRYHSLVVEKSSVPECIAITSYSRDDGEIMSLEIKGLPIYGVQFHPESITSKFGHDILENFLKL